MREVACLPKINVSGKWPKLPPIPTLRLSNNEQGFQARHRAFGVFDPTQVVLNSGGSLWVTGLNRTADPLSDDYYWIDGDLGQVYQLGSKR